MSINHSARSGKGQERVQNRHGKQAISVQATEVVPYMLLFEGVMLNAYAAIQ